MFLAKSETLKPLQYAQFPSWGPKIHYIRSTVENQVHGSQLAHLILEQAFSLHPGFVGQYILGLIVS